MASEQEGLEEEEAEFDEASAAAEESAVADGEYECGGGSSDEDGAAGGSFQSADDDDDFDLPQVLRHAAHKLDVRIRKDGFVRLREIMKLRTFKPYQLEELMAVVYFDEKERYTMVRKFDGELLIRANQGHTMKVVEDDLLLDHR